MLKNISTTSWDSEYLKGKYLGDEPIDFVYQIITTLKSRKLIDNKGLYPGCGNGRNYLYLFNAGLNIDGLDISTVAINQLKNKLPQAKLSVDDFMKISNKRYSYIVSIQLFQHGNFEQTENLFNKAYKMLLTGGLLFLRVNSINTQIKEKYEIFEHTKMGGLTIKYLSGPKKGMLIHFYTKQEINYITSEKYKIIQPIKEDYIKRDDLTSWSQWEIILQKV